MKRLLIPVLVLGLTLAAASQAQEDDFDVMLADVELRPGVTVDLRVRVYVNDRQPCEGRTVLLVPGAWSTADPWFFSHFTEAFFDQNPAGRKACRVAVLDAPGRGGSSLPRGGPVYGDLTLADYTAAVLGALERLPDSGVRPVAILGYSRGGIATALAQQALVRRGTNLRGAFGIRTVLLLSPLPPAGVPWAIGEIRGMLYDMFVRCYTGPGGDVSQACWWLDSEPDGDVDYADLLRFNPTHTWDCDPDTTPLGMPPLPAPVDEGLCEAGTPYGDTFVQTIVPGNPIHESATAIYELYGAMQYERPVTNRGIFGPQNGTVLWSVGLEKDTTVLPSETAASYEHYTGNRGVGGFVLAEGPTTNHFMIALDPERLLEGIAGKVKFP